MISSLPTTPAILLSTINTLLRDGEFENLADLCAYYEHPVYTAEHVVADTETADVVGSGLLPVYATPSVVALMEGTACGLLAQPPYKGDLEGLTTVGTRIAVDHLKACRVGETVSCTAMLLGTNGRAYDFLIEVRNTRNELLAKAEHTRFSVDPERFMAKLP